MQKNKKVKIRRETSGTVVSDKMNKTIVVKVSRLAVHPVFKKRIKRFNKLKVHDEKGRAKVGDTVKIRETRPLSKDKRWRLIEVTEKAES